MVMKTARHAPATLVTGGAPAGLLLTVNPVKTRLALPGTRPVLLVNVVADQG